MNFDFDKNFKHLVFYSLVFALLAIILGVFQSC